MQAQKNAANYMPQATNLFVKQQRRGRSCVFEPQKLRALLNEAIKESQFWGTLFTTLALSGARITEVTTARWRDVREDELHVNASRNKVNPERAVRSPELVRVLNNWREKRALLDRPATDDTLVFPSKNPTNP